MSVFFSKKKNDIEETIIGIEHSQTSQSEKSVSISSSHQSSTPMTSKSGLGYVHAGLLLWLEAEEADDDDDDES